MRRENNDERLAQRWLEHQGHEDIRRPRSDPPDFVVDGAVAVEVTRLSQLVDVGDDKRSVSEEERRKPLTALLKKLLNGLGTPGNEGRSWDVTCEYDLSEPLPPRKIVEAQVRDALAPLTKPYDDGTVAAMHLRHLDRHKHADEVAHLEFPHLCLACGICLEPAEFSHSPARFKVLNVSDGKGIGPAAELTRSVRDRISAKSETIRRQGRVGTYSTWWLVLVDRVALLPMHILSEHELASVRNQEFDFWDRVAVISSTNLDWHYDLICR